jgi:hypothetical protein
VEAILFDWAALLDLLKPLDRFLSYFMDPLGGASSQFGMVFGPPSPLRGAQRLALSIELDLALGEVDKKGSALPVADQFIDFSNYFGRVRDHDSLTWHDLLFYYSTA